MVLYSAVFTRTLSKYYKFATLFKNNTNTSLNNYRVRADLDAPKGSHLMGPNEEGSLNIISLLLTGRATPYLHNGVIYVGDDNHYAIPQFGILSRCGIGLLVYEGDSGVAVIT